MKTHEVVFIIDKSGSMCDLVSDTIGGFNSMLNEQKANNEDGKVLVSTVLFNERRKVIHDREDIANIEEMTKKNYVPSGCTALIDAIGYSIKHIDSVHKYIREEDIPDHTLFIIITDGLENASHTYSSNEVKKMIKEKQDKDNWEFMFIGANIDAVETAEDMGIYNDYAINYMADGLGQGLVYKSVSKKISASRKAKRFCKTSNACFADVTTDYNRRKKS